MLAYCMAAASRAATVNVPGPDFALTSSQGKQRTLSSYKGKVVFINFWASWCAPCADELPKLNQLAIDERGKGVSIVAINVEQDQTKAGRLLATLGLDSPEMEILWDPGSKTVAAYDPKTMPSSFILDGRGVIRFVHSGFHEHDPNKWRKEIASLLGASENALKETNNPEPNAAGTPARGSDRRTESNGSAGH
jgi:thiol-disulfide isomerase/thioredoxin